MLAIAICMLCMGLHVDYRRLHFIIWFWVLLALYVGYRHLHVMHGVACRLSSTALHYLVPGASGIVRWLSPSACYAWGCMPTIVDCTSLFGSGGFWHCMLAIAICMLCMGLHADYRRLHFIIWFWGLLALYVGYRHLHVMHGVACRLSSTALQYLVPGTSGIVCWLLPSACHAWG
jgi:hypothetical protein